jgi:shikimate kinase
VRERLEELLRERGTLYAEAAHVRVATDGKSPERVADAVLAAVAGV